MVLVLSSSAQQTLLLSVPFVPVRMTGLPFERSVAFWERMRFVSHERVEDVSGQAGRKDGVDLDEGLHLLRLLFVVRAHVAVRGRRLKGLVGGEEGGPVRGRRFDHPVDHREVRRASAGVGAGKRDRLSRRTPSSRPSSVSDAVQEGRPCRAGLSRTSWGKVLGWAKVDVGVSD